MKKIKLIILIIFTLLLGCSKNKTVPIQKTSKDITSYVDPFIGTGGHGHTFPGATLPYGMVQLSPDTRMQNWDGSSGYHYSDNTIMGFSHTHLSGTGAPEYTDILLMPTVGKVQIMVGDEKDSKTGYRSSFSHNNEKALPGYYSVLLDDSNIKVELTASTRAGFHKYTFPKTEQANVILDLVHGNADWTDDLFVQIIENEISGYRTASGGLEGTNTVFFVANFSMPFESYGLAENDSILNNVNSAKGRNVKAFFTFSANNNEPILLKVAISMVGIEGARKNLKVELSGWDFELTKKLAKETWDKELSKIDIEGGTKEQRSVFYSTLYHMFIHPNINMDVDRKYRSTNDKIYNAVDFDNYTNFSLWDTFRGLHPLQTILNPSKTNQFIRTFLERYDHGLHMPVMEFSRKEVSTMIGYHSVPVVADSYVKGIRDYDVLKAFDAMKQLADKYEPGKKAYLQYGFISYDLEGQSTSRTLEYSYDDWCVTRLAKDYSDLDFNYYNQRGKFGTEIDICEFNRKDGEDIVSHNLHWAYDPNQQSIGALYCHHEGVSEGFHTVALEWTPEKYASFVDGYKYQEVTRAISQIKEYIVLSMELPNTEELKGAVLPDVF